VLVLQRVLPAREDMRRLRDVFDRIVFDIDDAIYAVPPQVGEARHILLTKNALRAAVRGSPRASSRRKPLIRTLRSVDVCVAGNSVLSGFACRFAPRVVAIPTAVDPVAAAPRERPDTPVLVWLGLPDNLQYLDLIRAPLARLVSSTDLVLRIVSGRTWSDAPLPVEFVPFSEEAADKALLTATAGLSPLTDDPWTRGKCAMRAVQYGGHGLAAVASPVGITDQVVRPGRTGFLPRSSDEWLAAMRLLVSDRDKATEMGVRALDHIRRSFSNTLALERWVAVLEETARFPARTGMSA
jgi:hypothetical protein